MRKYINIVTESPIADFDTVGKLGDGRDGARLRGTKEFNTADWKVTQSHKAIAKIFRIFERTPYVFNFIVMFTSEKGFDQLMYENNKTAEHLSEMVGKPVITDGRITMVVNNQVSAPGNRMPLSAWTLAHRFGHAIHLNTGHTPQTSNHSGDNDIKLAQIWYDGAEKLSAITQRNIVTGRQNEAEMGVIFCTFKAARDNNINSNWEIIADLFAQYLIAGKIRLNRIETVTAVDLANRLSKSSIKRCNMILDQLEADLNTEMKNILDNLVGKIVGF